jgi:hypothetical protein
MTSAMERLDRHCGQARTRSGPASYVDTGGPGRVGLFVHGMAPAVTRGGT